MTGCSRSTAGQLNELARDFENGRVLKPVLHPKVGDEGNAGADGVYLKERKKRRVMIVNNFVSSGIGARE